jgi:hypothetical protein
MRRHPDTLEPEKRLFTDYTMPWDIREIFAGGNLEVKIKEYII